MTLQGAGKAAVGTEVLIVDRLDPNALLDVLDDRLQTLRTDSARQAIHALDAARRPQFGTEPDPRHRRRLRQPAGLNDFCTANGITRCDPVVIQG